MVMVGRSDSGSGLAVSLNPSYSSESVLLRQTMGIGRETTTTEAEEEGMIPMDSSLSLDADYDGFRFGRIEAAKTSRPGRGERERD